MIDSRRSEVVEGTCGGFDDVVGGVFVGRLPIGVFVSLPVGHCVDGLLGFCGLGALVFSDLAVGQIVLPVD